MLQNSRGSFYTEYTIQSTRKIWKRRGGRMTWDWISATPPSGTCENENSHTIVTRLPNQKCATSCAIVKAESILIRSELFWSSCINTKSFESEDKYNKFDKFFTYFAECYQSPIFHRSLNKYMGNKSRPIK